MNRYFSRLAERSGVVANVGRSRSDNAAHTAVDWAEQSFETTAPASTTTAIAGDQSVETGNESHIGTTSDITQSSTTMRLSNIATPTFDSAQEITNPGDSKTSRGSQAMSETSSVGPEFSDYDQTTVTTSARFSASGDPVVKHSSTSENQQDVSAFPDQSRSRAEARQSRIDTRALDADATSIAETKPARLATSRRHRVPIKANADASITELQDSRTSQVAGANAMPTKSLAGTTGKVERVSSSPIQTPSLPTQSTRPVSRPSIEVNIGKIELEVFAPATKPAAPPAPAPSNVPRPKPAVAFNPHRHYLRGR
ncbi:MAG: hypothetical protein ACREO1_13980 [Arenimonas sp.]